jgi:hypothetical protein
MLIMITSVRSKKLRPSGKSLFSEQKASYNTRMNQTPHFVSREVDGYSIDSV